MAMGQRVLGSYYPGEGFLYRMGALTKLILLFVWGVLIFWIQSFPLLIILFMGSCVLAAIARVSFTASPLVVLTLLFMLAMVLAMNTFTFDGSGEAVLGAIGFSWEGFLSGSRVVLRILFVTLLALVFITTTRVSDIMQTFVCMLSPLRRFGVPVDDLAMIATIALRGIPLCSQMFMQIKDAQNARGACLGRGSFVQTVKGSVRIFIPLVVGLFRQAEDMSQAMLNRAYGIGVPTSLYDARMSKRDLIVTICGTLLPVLLIIMSCYFVW
ncbi:MAG: energy-coupling factor transporter transmembrane protein EcfT [Coriobacteriales bacterium]|nr:energy-coupling factor transporter transmembrane protein EcfT [Coriobacteriales bacterium]